MTRQRLHKTANILNWSLFRSNGAGPLPRWATRRIPTISGGPAGERAGAEEAFDRFLAKYGAKYEKASACLSKDRDTLLAFYDVPAEPWQHVRSTNPIESMFATVRLRTNKTKGCLSSDTALAMVFKLAKSAERHWRRLNGTNPIGQIIDGTKSRDGEPTKNAENHDAP